MGMTISLCLYRSTHFESVVPVDSVSLSTFSLQKSKSVVSKYVRLWLRCLLIPFQVHSIFITSYFSDSKRNDNWWCLSASPRSSKDKMKWQRSLTIVLNYIIDLHTSVSEQGLSIKGDILWISLCLGDNAGAYHRVEFSTLVTQNCPPS